MKIILRIPDGNLLNNPVFQMFRQRFNHGHEFVSFIEVDDVSFLNPPGVRGIGNIANSSERW